MLSLVRRQKIYERKGVFKKNQALVPSKNSDHEADFLTI